MSPASRCSGAATATSASGSTATRCARAVSRRPTCSARSSANTSRCRAARSRATASTTPSRPTPSSAPSKRWRRWSSRTTPARRCCCATSRASRTAPRTSRSSRATTALPPSASASASRAAATPSRSSTRCGSGSARSRRCCRAASRCTTRRASSTSRTAYARRWRRPSSRWCFGALLAVFTVWVFLRRSRPTFIIAAAIPVSLIATFGLVYLAGFTLNTMTLLGMALAVGVVIDDAIVVLENIERHRELGEERLRGGEQGHPRDRLRGDGRDRLRGGGVPAGALRAGPRRQLPARLRPHRGGLRAALALRRADADADAGGAHAAALRARARQLLSPARARLRLAREPLQRLLDWTLDHRGATVAVALVSLFGACGLGSRLEAEFFPPADEGIFFARLEAPPGTSLDATQEYLERDEAWFLDQPEIVGLFSAAGSSGGGNEAARHAETNMGMIFGTMQPARGARAQRDATGARRAPRARRRCRAA